jgi:hypothetical protein
MVLMAAATKWRVQKKDNMSSGSNAQMFGKMEQVADEGQCV